MGDKEFEVVTITEEVSETFRLVVKPKNPADQFSFLAGQFCTIKNPASGQPQQPHSFSIASSPIHAETLEFCFRVYGPWTQLLSQTKPGDVLLLRGPFGRFVWDSALTNAVFLAGGVGIVPMLSMLRYLAETGQHPTITIIYGSRSPSTIVYQNQLAELAQKIGTIRIVDVLSEVKPQDPWPGYKGFVSKEILQTEANLASQPTFFLCGPPVFVKLVSELLAKLNVPATRVKQELYSSPPPPKPASAT